MVLWEIDLIKIIKIKNLKNMFGWDDVFVSQSCSVVDPNTGFEFNLQLLASKTGYKTNANGKDFLVRQTHW